MKRLIFLTLAFLALMVGLSFTTPEQRRELIWNRVMADGTPNKYAGWDANGDPVELDAGSGDMVLANVQTSTGKKTFQPDATNPGINMGSLAGDPTTPANGDMWYNSSTNFLRARINGSNHSLNALTSTYIGYGDANGMMTGTNNLLYSTTLGFRVRGVSTNQIALFQNSSGGSVLDINDARINLTGSGARQIKFEVGDKYLQTTSNVEVAQETYTIRAGNGNVTANAGDHLSVTGGSALVTSGAAGGNLTLSPGTGDGAGANGNIIFLNVPTSSAGLPSGAIWSNAGVITIVP